MVPRTDYSDDWPLAMQRRYHMQQRSPLIFWLLLAATLSIDVVAISWAYTATLNRTEELYFGLACGQISLVCIGAYFSAARRLWWWFAPFAASVAAAVLTSWLYSLAPFPGSNAYQNFLTYLSVWIPQVALLLAVLWLLRQTSYAQRLGEQSGPGRWQFATRHLLAIMTALAIVLVILRQAQDVHDIWFVLAAWVANNVALAIAAVLIHATRLHSVLRLAATVGIALILALAVAEVHPADSKSLPINLIQSLVLFLWLHLGEIVPKRRGSNDDGNAVLLTP